MATKKLSGMDLVLFFRKYADKAISDGSKLKFQTEHSISKSKENEATSTKDGLVNGVRAGEGTADITSIAYVEDDATQEVWKELEQWFDDEEFVEVWEVDTTSATGGTSEYEATYYQGYFTDFEKSAPADGDVELSITFAINGNGVKGTDILSEGQLASLNNALYEYESITAPQDELDG